MERNIPQLKNKIKELLDQQKLGVLATQGGKYPYNTLVAYTFSEDLRYIFFATRKHTRKYNNIMKHHHVSMLIDSRTNNVTDFEDAVALTVMGKNIGTFLIYSPYAEPNAFTKSFSSYLEIV